MRINDFRRGTYASQNVTNNQGDDSSVPIGKDQAKLNGMVAANDDFVNVLSGSKEDQSKPVKFVDENSTKEEYMSALRGFTAEYLFEYDQNYGNKDGIVSVEEHEKAIFEMGVVSAINSGDLYTTGSATPEDIAQIQAMERMSHLYTEGMDFDDDGKISVEEASTLYAYADKCVVDGLENDPQGTITPEAANAVDEYMIGFNLSDGNALGKYLAGEELDENDAESYSRYVSGIRENTKAIGEDLGIDFSKQSGYFDVFDE